MERIKTLIPDLKILKISVILIQDIQALKKLEFLRFANVP
jgi:hypothetical protein